MKAIVNRNKTAVLEDRPKPKLRDDYLLVKTVAVALNPTDWKHAAFGLTSEGGLLGCDFAGIVEEVGSAVTKAWKKGDRIAGVAHGGNYVQPEDGAFAEYVVAKGDLQLKINGGVSFEAAATVPLGATTVGQGLYQKGLKLNLPTDPITDKEYVLVYGGSTATGTLAIQYAKLSGYTVLTTSSPKHFAHLKSLGATECWDYKDAATPQKIKDYTSGSLKLAFDTVSEESSAKFCADCLSGGRYASLLQSKCPAPDVETVNTLMYTVFGEEFKFGPTTVPAMPEDFEFAKQFMSLTEELLNSGKLQPHPQVVGPDGLKGVLKGLDDLKAGHVSGSKLVYRVGETP